MAALNRYALAIIALAFAVRTEASSSLSWDECVRLAAENNAELQSAEATLRSSRELSKAAWSGFLPQVSANVGFGDVDSTTSYTASISATQNLFEMVERFHAHCPPEQKQRTATANAKELSFDALDSGYKIGTAGTKGVGRSSTIQLFHGSEVAFWPHAATHAAGVLQAVPDLPASRQVW